MTRYAVAVGGNRGDVIATHAQAAACVAADGLVRVVAHSAWYRTAAVGGPVGQGDFLNAVWLVATDLGPHQLLHRLQAIEHACGRTREVRWGPRTCDLDVVLAEDGRRCASSVLTLPHPRLRERQFVLVPLCEVAAGWIVPGWGTVRRLADDAQRASSPPAPVKA